MNNDPQQPERRVGLTVWLILSQLITGAGTLVWLALSIVPFLFWDDPNAKGSPAGVAAVFWLLALIPLGLSIAAWVAFIKRKNKLAAILTGIPFVPAILCSVGLLIVAATGYINRP